MLVRMTIVMKNVHEQCCVNKKGRKNHESDIENDGGEKLFDIQEDEISCFEKAYHKNGVQFDGSGAISDNNCKQLMQQRYK